MTHKQMETVKPLLKREFDTNETLQLLKRYGFKFWSWGANNFVNVQNKGLLFKVNGHHHKGYVLICLDWSDTYDVHIITTHGNLLNSYDTIFFEMLFDVIDERIEKIPEYSR